MEQQNIIKEYGSEYHRIKSLLKEHGRDYQYQEKKQSYTEGKKDIADRKIKRRTDLLLKEIFEETEVKEEIIKQVRTFIIEEVWKYYINSKRKPKVKPFLKGSSLDITIKAVTYEIVRGIVMGLFMKERPPIYEIEYAQREHNLIKDFMKTVQKIEDLPEINRIKNKSKRICEIKQPKEFYELYDIDKLYEEFDVKKLGSLFEIDEKRYKEQCYLGFPITKEHIDEANKDFVLYSKEIAYQGFILALRFIEKSEDKNKKLKGLVGACFYICSKINYEKNNHWIKPKKSISKWAKIYNVNREVFSERVKLIESCGFFA